MSETLDTLKAYVPPFVQEDPMMAAFYAAVAPELEAVMDLGVSIPAQAWPHLVDWGISRLESIYGIPSDEAATLAKRRSVLQARMRGAGTSTREHIEGIANSFSGGAVLLTEDYANYKITVEFTDDLGVPPYLKELKDALRAAIPAHLLIEYILLWTTWGDLVSAGITWGDLGTAGITWGQLKTYNTGG